MLIGIFGTGRNGSTLLGRLLDGLGATYVHPVEENFLSVLADLSCQGSVRRITGQNCTTAPLRGLEHAISREALTTAYQGSLDALRRSVEANLPFSQSRGPFRLDEMLPKSSYPADEFVREYLASAAAVFPESRHEHHAFKTIETPYVTDYATRFPDMRFIHIVRDPVVVCSSQKRSLMETKRYPATYIGHDWLVCMIDKRWVPHARTILALRDDSRHIVVRYEDLVASPVVEISRLASWLGTSPPERPNVQTIFGNRDFAVLDDNPSKSGIQTPREAMPNLREKFGYVEVLTAREIDLINFKTADLQCHFGYKPSTQPSLPQVLSQYLCIDSWEWKNVRGPVGILRALYGMLYRRAAIFHQG